MITLEVAYFRNTRNGENPVFTTDPEQHRHRKFQNSDLLIILKVKKNDKMLFFKIKNFVRLQHSQGDSLNSQIQYKMNREKQGILWKFN